MIDWPKHPDGRNMKIGEMTPEQARAVTKGACDKLQKDRAFLAALAAMLQDGN